MRNIINLLLINWYNKTLGNVKNNFEKDCNFFLRDY